MFNTPSNRSHFFIEQVFFTAQFQLEMCWLGLHERDTVSDQVLNEKKVNKKQPCDGKFRIQVERASKMS